jgi:hypothetical protein
MAALLSLLVVLALSLVVMRVGAAALVLTGVSAEAARFQAQSAFLGVGFTTRESEQVLAHPVRRRIVMLLMLLGNAGVVAGVSTVVLLFLGAPERGSGTARVAALVAVVVAFWVGASSRWVDRHVTRLVEWALRRWTRLDVRDYVSLLRLAGEFAVVELEVRPGGWLAGRTLAELDLRSEGALVLGIARPGDVYVGVPRGPTRIEADDVLIMYGRAPLLDDLGQRPPGEAGDQAHHAAVASQRHLLGLDAELPNGPGPHSARASAAASRTTLTAAAPRPGLRREAP